MTTPKSGLHLPRRQLLLGASALAAAPLAMPHIARAAEPLKVGLLLAKTGQIAGQTEYLANGAMLALEERNKMIMGRPAELVWYDEPSPQGANQNMQKLVQEEKVAAVIGGALSSSALAEEAKAAELKIPFACMNAAATEITGKNCNRYTFRLNTPVAVQVNMLSPFALKSGKKWYFITASYAFGQDILKSSREALKAAGGTEVGSDEVPLNTPDFSSYILKIRQANPDVVIGGLSAGDLTTFLKQWNELGMRSKVPFFEIAIGDTDIWGVGPEAATGTFTKLWDAWNPNNPPAEKAFAAAYLKKHGKPAADKAWMGWISARSMFESIDAAKSTDPNKIIEALEAWKVPGAGYSYSYRKGDHQMLLRNLAVEVKPKITSKYNYFNVKAELPENVADLEKVYGSPEANGCKMM